MQGICRTLTTPRPFLAQSGKSLHSCRNPIDKRHSLSDTVGQVEKKKGAVFMSEKVSIKTLWDILKEIDKGAADKSRTIDDITDKKVKEIITRESLIAASAGLAKAALGVGTASAVISGVGATVGTTAIAGAVSVKAGVAVGAAAGSTVPIIGTIIGAAVGLGVGILVGWLVANKDKNEKQRLNQEYLAKQNGALKRLEKEKEELEGLVNWQQQQIKRQEYIIGLVKVFGDLEGLCAT